MENLTQKQRQFFEDLKNTYAGEPLPSFDFIKVDLNFRCKNSVAQYFRILKGKGFILEKHKRFFINPDVLGAPLCTTSIRAGFQAAIEDSAQKRLSLDNEFGINDPSTFLFTVAGDSMVDLGIFEGDNVIIKKTSEAKDGDIVIASVDGDYTLKTYRERNGQTYLEPANALYENIIPKQSLTIFGIAVGVTRKF